MFKEWVLRCIDWKEFENLAALSYLIWSVLVKALYLKKDGVNKSENKLQIVLKLVCELSNMDHIDRVINILIYKKGSHLLFHLFLFWGT